jgi:membrane protease YdiL (CAAX protease family)
MGLGASLLFFGIPSCVFAFNVYVLIPLTVRSGLSVFAGYTLFYFGFFTLLIVPAVAAHRREGRPATLSAFGSRMMIGRMDPLEWLLALSVLLIFAASSLAFLPTQVELMKLPAFAPPAFLPSWADPRAVQEGVWLEFMGYPVAGKWWLAPLFLLLFLSNILGETTFLRGYCLPRQELAFGRLAWVVNGLLCALFYCSVWRWNILVSIPTHLALSYMVQRRRNLSPAMAVYFAVNVLGMTPLFLGTFAHP